MRTLGRAAWEMTDIDRHEELSAAQKKQRAAQQ
jgi:hypothetical protein